MYKLRAYENSICTNCLYIVERPLFHYMNYSIMRMRVQKHLQVYFFSPKPTFQGTQPLQSETAKLLASWAYTGIIFVTINMQTGDD